MDACIADPFGDDIIDFADSIYHAHLWHSFVQYEYLKLPQVKVDSCVERDPDLDNREASDEEDDDGDGD